MPYEYSIHLYSFYGFYHMLLLIIRYKRAEPTYHTKVLVYYGHLDT